MTELNDKQKVILEAVLKIEAAVNGLIRDANEEGLPMDLAVINGQLHFSVDQRELILRQILDM